MAASEDTDGASAMALDVSKPNIARVYDHWLRRKVVDITARIEHRRVVGGLINEYRRAA